MGTRAWLMALVTIAAAGAMGQAPRASEPAAPATGRGTAIRFEVFDLYVDSGPVALAAYQVELRATGDTRVVGIEGREGAAFTEAPYYDPAALHEGQLQERIVLAAFDTGDHLPAGRTRVARLHVQVSGAEPEWTVKVQSAGTDTGTRIEAKAEMAKAG